MEPQNSADAALAINDPRAIDALLHMKTIAVVGLSADPMRDSYRVSEYMANHGYEIIPVNPTVSSTLGQHSYADLADVDRPVEVVNVFRRSEYVAAIVDKAIAMGAKGIWLQYGVIDEAAAAKAQRAGLLVVMDRCIKVEHMRHKYRQERAVRQGRTPSEA